MLIFLIPPTLEELGNRLVNRGTEDKETINRRICRALEEMELVDQYDYVVVNERVEEAVEDVETILRAESMKCVRNQDIQKIFKGEI